MTDLITRARAAIEAERCRPDDELPSWCATHEGGEMCGAECHLHPTGLVNRLRDLLAVVEAVTALADADDYEHNPGCEGEPECPACWVLAIRAALTPKEGR